MTVPPEQIEVVLQQFRQWFGQLTNEATEPTAAKPIWSVSNLVGEFTALRHDVQLQTKASRQAIDQTGQAFQVLGQRIQSLTAPTPAADSASADSIQSHLKALVDIADALRLSLDQVSKMRDQLEESELTWPEPPEIAREMAAPKKRSWWSRLFRSADSEASEPSAEAWRDYAAELQSQLESWKEHIEPRFTSLADGYNFSLRRIEQLLEKVGLMAMPTLDEPFDPETMEVLETVDDSSQPSGIVVEELRVGYRYKDQIFRYAQVRVSR